VNRVFFLHPRWQKGGVETTNERWAAILSKLGKRSIAFTCDSDTNKIHNMEVINAKSLYHLLLLEVTKLKRNDVLLVCQSYYILKILPFIIYLRLRGVRLIITERNSFDQFNDFPIKQKIYEYLFPLVFLLFDKIIVNSVEMSAETIYRFSKDRLVVIKNPRFTEADLTLLMRQKPLYPSKIIYTFCRWAPQKDPDFMVAVGEFCKQKNFDFTVFCNQKAYDFQKPLVNSAFVYMKNNPGILFFASKFEGYPNILIEARALGLPIIFAACNTGVREILEGYERAFEFRKSDMKSFEAAVRFAQDSARSQKCQPDTEFAIIHSERMVNVNLFKSAFCLD